MSQTALISSEQRLAGNRVLLLLRGDLDYDTAPYARVAVAEAQGRTRELVIDLSGVERADAFGLAVVLTAWHAGPRAGCRVRVVKASRSVQRAWCSAKMLRPLGRLASPSHAHAA